MLFFTKLCLFLLPSHSQSPSSFPCLEINLCWTRRQINSQSMQLAYFSPKVNRIYRDIQKTSPALKHKPKIYQQSRKPTKQTPPVLVLNLKLIAHCRSIRWGVKNVMVQHRHLWLGSEHHSKSIDPGKTDPSINSEFSHNHYQPPLLYPSETQATHRYSTETHRSCRVGWGELKMIFVFRWHSPTANIDTLQTLHLAKASNGRPPSIFCSALLFSWKSHALP